MTHAFPRFEWTPCAEPPTDCRRVLIWHRVRPWCRFFHPVVGWWNSKEWRQNDSNAAKHGVIYQPALWKDIDTPPAP